MDWKIRCFLSRCSLRYLLMVKAASSQRWHLNGLTRPEARWASRKCLLALDMSENVLVQNKQVTMLPSVRTREYSISATQPEKKKMWRYCKTLFLRPYSNNALLIRDWHIKFKLFIVFLTEYNNNVVLSQRKWFQTSGWSLDSVNSGVMFLQVLVKAERGRTEGAEKRIFLLLGQVDVLEMNLQMFCK